MKRNNSKNFTRQNDWKMTQKQKTTNNQSNNYKNSPPKVKMSMKLTIKEEITYPKMLTFK